MYGAQIVVDLFNFSSIRLFQLLGIGPLNLNVSQKLIYYWLYLFALTINNMLVLQCLIAILDTKLYL